MPIPFRRLLMILLMVCLPIQGWASAGMAVSMAVGHHARAEVGASMAHAAVAHDHHAHDRGVHLGGAHDESAMADCCAGHAEALNAGGHGGHNGPCGDSCHCCISAAPPSKTVALGMQAPPSDWGRTTAPARPQAMVFSLDKPPKA